MIMTKCIAINNWTIIVIITEFTTFQIMLIIPGTKDKKNAKLYASILTGYLLVLINEKIGPKTKMEYIINCLDVIDLFLISFFNFFILNITINPPNNKLLLPW